MKALDSELVSPCSPLDPRWQLVQRIAASQLFSRGPKLRAFFLYICENSLLGRPENLTAQLIGSRVFGRDPDYIPSEDNIVRVEARELRKRLASYFSGEGRDEPIVIQIPKGSYAPVFVPRDAAETELGQQAGDAAAAERPRHIAGWRFAIVLGMLLAVSAGLNLWQAKRNPWRKQQEAFAAAFHQAASPDLPLDIYRDLFGPLGTNPQRQALLVLSNPRVITYSVAANSAQTRSTSEVSIPVPDEMKSTFAPMLKEHDRGMPLQYLNVTREGYTGIGEAVAAFHLGRLMNLLGRRVHLTQGRFLNWDHVDKQDLVLLGGPQSNDWRYEMDAKANFSIVGDSVVNAKPVRGEQARYRSDTFTDYAVVAKLTTPYNFETLVVAGVSSAGTAAAGEFLANPNMMQEVHRRLIASAGKRFPLDWEVLLRVAVRDGLPLKSSVVAVRSRRVQ